MPLHWEPTRRKTMLLAVLNRIAVLRRIAKRTKAVPDSDVKSILVIELWNIGDVVLVLPFLGALRTRFPSARISLLAGAHARELLEGSPLVDEVIVTSLGDNTASAWKKILELRRCAAEVGKRPFDLAFQNRIHIREYALMALSGIPRTVGYPARADDRVLTEPVTPERRNRHKTADWLGLQGSDEAFAVGLRVNESERAWATDFLARNGSVPGDTLVGIHPGASNQEKRWPLNKFREVAEYLARAEGIGVIGFADTLGFGAELWTVKGVVPAQVTLRQMVALLERCGLVVCNDSGPMHIAASLGVPTVAIFDGVVAEWFRPIGDLHQVITAASTDFGGDPKAQVQGRVSTVEVNSVLEAVASLLRRTNLNGANALGRIIASATDENSTLASE